MVYCYFSELKFKVHSWSYNEKFDFIYCRQIDKYLNSLIKHASYFI